MSRGEPLNPYESPVIPEEIAAAEPVPFIATFSMDDAGLLASGRINTAPIHPWIAWTAPLWLFVLATLFIGSAMVVGVLPAFACGSLTLIALTLIVVTLVQAVRDRYATVRTLQLLRAHPVLGATGRWRLSVEANEIFIETLGGRLPFSFRDTSFIAEDDHRLVIWFGENLPIVIPKHRAHSTMVKHLRRWITASAHSATTPGRTALVPKDILQ